MAMKCTKMHRFEPRFHHMKAAGLSFYTVKARFQTDYCTSFSSHISKNSFLGEIMKNPNFPQKIQLTHFWPKRQVEGGEGSEPYLTPVK